MDICILTERNISHGNILVQAISIGGFRMIDGVEADDKIIAILKGDEVYQQWDDIEKFPEVLVKRLKHYFLTYKDLNSASSHRYEITHTYNKIEALEVIEKRRKDYIKLYGNLESKLPVSIGKLVNNRK